jgi:hypothetical protein
MRALAIVVLMLSSCTPRVAYVRGDGPGPNTTDCDQLGSCENSFGGGASSIGLGVLAAAAAVGIGALLHELGTGHRRSD